MILLIDVGNTRIKWGVQVRGDWLRRGACVNAVAVAELVAAIDGMPLCGALASCVGSESLRREIEQALAARDIPLRWLAAAANAHGLISHYQPAESLGSDRYAALLAARRRNLGACLVVGSGTALTVDALTADGHFLGGTISPGHDLMLQSLLHGTAGIRDISACSDGFPNSTGSAVATGIALAQAGVVAALRDRLARRDGLVTVPVLLAGGARAHLAALIPPPLLEAEDLVLEGLSWIAEDETWED